MEVRYWDGAIPIRRLKVRVKWLALSRSLLSQCKKVRRSVGATVGAALRGRPWFRLMRFKKRRRQFREHLSKPRAATEGRPYSGTANLDNTPQFADALRRSLCLSCPKVMSVVTPASL